MIKPGSVKAACCTCRMIVCSCSVPRPSILRCQASKSALVNNIWGPAMQVSLLLGCLLRLLLALCSKLLLLGVRSPTQLVTLRA